MLELVTQFTEEYFEHSTAVMEWLTGGLPVAEQNDPPDDMRAGDTVIYHLPRNYHNDEDDFQGGHRLGLISRVYRARHTNRVAIDLLVMLSQGDDPRNVSGTVMVHDAVYDQDCPPGTFCEYTHDSDEMPTVGDVKEVLGQQAPKQPVKPIKPSTVQKPVPNAEDGSNLSSTKTSEASIPGETEKGEVGAGTSKAKADKAK